MCNFVAKCCVTEQTLFILIEKSWNFFFHLPNAQKKKNFAQLSFAMIIFSNRLLNNKKREKVHTSEVNAKFTNLFLHVWLKWAELKYNLQLNPKKAFSFREKRLAIVGCWMNMIQLKIFFFSLSFRFLSLHVRKTIAWIAGF